MFYFILYYFFFSQKQTYKKSDQNGLCNHNICFAKTKVTLVLTTWEGQQNGVNVLSIQHKGTNSFPCPQLTWYHCFHCCSSYHEWLQKGLGVGHQANKLHCLVSCFVSVANYEDKAAQKCCTVWDFLKAFISR